MVTLKKLELAVGVFVALGLAAFFMLAMKVSNIAKSATSPSWARTKVTK